MGMKRPNEQTPQLASSFQKRGLPRGEDSPMSWFTSQPLPLGDEAAKVTNTATRQLFR
jgi:hypothetical protein